MPSLAQFYLTAFGEFATHKLRVDEFSDFTMSYVNKLKKKASHSIDAKLDTISNGISNPSKDTENHNSGYSYNALNLRKKYYDTNRKRTNVIQSSMLMPAISEFDRINHDSKRPRHFNLFDRLSVFRFNEHPRALFICKL